jgi:chaperonin cofactor prefoldin
MDINEEEKDSLLLSDEDNLLDDSLEDNSLISENKIDEIAEANASLSTMDSDPFNLIKDVNSTLSKIEKKIDKDSVQLSKLDQLEEIKDELKKITSSNKVNEFNDVIDNDVSSSTNGNNLPDNTDLIIQIENLQEKIQKIETSNSAYEEKLKDIEETLVRFKKIENELEVEVIEEEIGQIPLGEENIFDDKVDEMKNNENINNSIKIHPKPKSNILVLILLLLILLVSGAVVLDSLGIVDLYLSEILKTFFS